MLPLRVLPLRLLLQLSQRHSLSCRPIATCKASSFSMAQDYKLKGLSGLDMRNGEKQEVEIEGVEDGKVLLVKIKDEVHAMSPKCTHYGAPLKNGVVDGSGRITCPWHGACFNVMTGDVEDAPALDSLTKYALSEKDGGVYITADEKTIKANRTTLDITCSAQGSEKLVIVGGGAGSTAALEALRKNGFKCQITCISSESARPYDRTKLSKALSSDIEKVAFRSPDYYKSGCIDIVHDEVTSIDFSSKTISSKSGKSYAYTKLILATGGSPRSLPLDGFRPGELKNVFLLRGLEHTQAISAALGQDSPKKVVVVGSSFIGMEIANFLVNQKHDVSVVGMEEVPTELVFGKKIGKIFQGILEKNGVKFHVSAQVSHASPKPSDESSVGAVHLKDGTELPADLVIQGVGVAPATKFLNGSKGAPSLEKDGSLLTDENFAVQGLSDVWAIGDIAKYPYHGPGAGGRAVRIEHWNVAQNAGRTAAMMVASNGSAKPKPFIPVFWSALGMQLRYCGNTMASGYDDVVVQGETSPDKPSFAAYYTSGDIVVAVATMGKDPIMVQCAELMRHDKMPSKKELENGADVMGIPLR